MVATAEVDLPAGSYQLAVTATGLACRVAVDGEWLLEESWSYSNVNRQEVIRALGSGSHVFRVECYATEGTSSIDFEIRRQDTASDIDEVLATSARTRVHTGPEPSSPRNLRAVDVGRQEFGLKWDDGPSAEEGFKVLMSTDGTTFVAIATLAAGKDDFVVQGLLPNKNYWCSVVALSQQGVPPLSNALKVRTLKVNTRQLPAANQSLTNIALSLAASGHVLSADPNSLEVGGRVLLRKDLAEATQRWKLERLADGTYTVWNLATNRVLDAPGAHVFENGSWLQLWSWHGGPNQRWTITEEDDGSLAIRNVESGKVLDAHAPDAAFDKWPLRLWEFLGNPDQKWRLAE
jgi:hypothetical protein